MIDTMQNIFECNICNKKYKYEKSLKTHMKLHDNKQDTKYYCNYCKKEFAYYQNRWRHEKTCKTKNKPYVLFQVL